MTIDFPADFPAADTIAKRLHHPRFVAGLAQLAERYFAQSVVIRARPMPPGTGPVTETGTGQKTGAGGPGGHYPFTIRDVSKLRGAWGDALLRGASENAQNNRPCNWAPECALFALFQAHGELEKGRVFHKPYDIAFTHGPAGEVEFRLTLHGFACDWIDEAASALVVALRHGLGKHKTCWQVLDRHIETIEGIAPLPAGTRYQMDLLTPLSMRQGGMVRQDLSSLLVSFAWRLQSMARWQDTDLVFSDVFFAGLRAVRTEHHARDIVGWNRKSWRQNGRIIPLAGLTGTLMLENLCPEAKMLLAFAPLIPPGARTSVGFGRVRIGVAGRQ